MQSDFSLSSSSNSMHFLFVRPVFVYILVVTIAEKGGKKGFVQIPSSF